MNYDIQILKTKKSKNFSSVEKGKDSITYKLFYSNLIEYEKAKSLMIECIVDDIPVPEIFNILSKEKFSNTAKKVKEIEQYKIRNILGTNYIHYIK